MLVWHRMMLLLLDCPRTAYHGRRLEKLKVSGRSHFATYDRNEILFNWYDVDGGEVIAITDHSQCAAECLALLSMPIVTLWSVKVAPESDGTNSVGQDTTMSLLRMGAPLHVHAPWKLTLILGAVRIPTLIIGRGF